MVPRSDTAIIEIAFCRPAAVSEVPSMGSTAISHAGPRPVPTNSPLKSIGALSFSPSPMTTNPSKSTVPRNLRIASTAAPSAPNLSPLPMNGTARMAAASVARTSSRARLRSGWRKSAPVSEVTLASLAKSIRLGRAGGGRHASTLSKAKQLARFAPLQSGWIESSRTEPDR